MGSENIDGLPVYRFADGSLPHVLCDEAFAKYPALGPWMNGQTMLVTETGGGGIYLWDLKRFLGGRKVVD